MTSKHIQELMQNQSCTSPSSVHYEQGSDAFIAALATHSWQIENHQNLHGLGLIIRFKCSRCNIEWSNIVVEEEKHGASSGEKVEPTTKKSSSFEF
jgi:hypothetical protein